MYWLTARNAEHRIVALWLIGSPLERPSSSTTRAKLRPEELISSARSGLTISMRLPGPMATELSIGYSRGQLSTSLTGPMAGILIALPVRATRMTYLPLWGPGQGSGQVDRGHGCAVVTSLAYTRAVA